MSVLPLPAGVGPGSYGVVRTSGFVAWTIRKLTRSTYDHAFIVTGFDGTIIEAEPNGARIGQITEYDDVAGLTRTGVIPATGTSLADAEHVVTQAADTHLHL